MAQRLSEKSRILVQFPLVLLTRIADVSGKLTATEMETFEKLVDNTSWCKCDLLKRALTHTRAQKDEIWRDYVNGDLCNDFDSVAGSLDSIQSSLDETERETFRRDVLYFCKRIVRSTGGLGGLLVKDRDAKAEYAELKALIRGRAADDSLKSSEGAGWAAPDVDHSSLLSADGIGDQTCWHRSKILLRCIGVIAETHDVKTFQFTADPPKLFLYNPGQFVSLDLTINGKAVRRSYTISSSPSRPHVLSITVKRVPEGLVSNWLHDNLQTGDELFAQGPNGTFSCIGDDSQKLLFISAGSGITPVMSMARWLHDTAARRQVQFIHWARKPEDFIFGEELRLFENCMLHFDLSFVCTRTSGPAEWPGETGRLSLAKLKALCPDYLERSVYCCGPGEFMSGAQQVFANSGLRASRYHQESFGQASPQPTGQGSGREVTIVFTESKKQITCRDTDVILDVANQNGIDVEWSCRAGQCGTCKAVLRSGDVTQDVTDGLTDDDAAEGYILTCQAFAKSQIEIEL